MQKYIIKIPEECSISNIYDTIAATAGLSLEGLGFDCRKVCVSEDIFKAFEAYMVANNREDAIGAIWLVIGPKVKESLSGGEVEIEDGFFVNLESND